jgi:hypothetical protein
VTDCIVIIKNLHESSSPFCPTLELSDKLELRASKNSLWDLSKDLKLKVRQGPAPKKRKEEKKKADSARMSCYTDFNRFFKKHD